MSVYLEVQAATAYHSLYVFEPCKGFNYWQYGVESFLDLYQRFFIIVWRPFHSPLSEIHQVGYELRQKREHCRYWCISVCWKITSDTSNITWQQRQTGLHQQWQASYLRLEESNELNNVLLPNEFGNAQTEGCDQRRRLSDVEYPTLPLFLLKNKN